MKNETQLGILLTSPPSEYGWHLPQIEEGDDISKWLCIFRKP